MTSEKQQLKERHEFAEGNTEASKHSAGGAPEGNSNSLKHGVYATPSNLTEHLSDDELEWIQEIVDGYLERAAFDANDPRAERLVMVAVKLYQEWAAENQMLKEGLSEDTTIGVNKQGEPIVNKDSHHLRRASNQLSKESRLLLRELGLLNPPEQQQAEAQESVAQAFERAVDRMDNE